MDIHERVKEVRKASNLTQKEFGMRIAVAQNYLSNLEKGYRDVTEKIIKIICAEFNINEKWLKYGTGNMYIENDDTIISELSNKYNLDNLDVKILESYLKLSGEQRKAIKKYVYSLVDTILEDDELYQDYRSEYIEENSQLSAARNGNTENIEEAINLYDNLDDNLER
ncbi:helix-turn-helix transcriptional regulator [Clostridioides difficile]|nr:helix-turn-helix transcriptional regulator [Clostridioides difficile]